MSDEPRDITREVCSARKASTHHLRPKREGRGAILVCAYCGKTSIEIRASEPGPTLDLHFTIDQSAARKPQHKHRR